MRRLLPPILIPQSATVVILLVFSTSLLAWWTTLRKLLTRSKQTGRRLVNTRKSGSVCTKHGMISGEMPLKCLNPIFRIPRLTLHLWVIVKAPRLVHPACMFPPRAPRQCVVCLKLWKTSALALTPNPETSVTLLLNLPLSVSGELSMLKVLLPPLRNGISRTPTIRPGWVS